MEKKHSLRQPARQNKQQIREAHTKKLEMRCFNEGFTEDQDIL